jgi:beta-glucanase (GH16 family)
MLKPLIVALALVSLTWGAALGDGAAKTEDPKPLAKGIDLSGYRLAWRDEFDGEKVDTEKWEFRTDSKMWSAQRAANVSVKDGVLRIALKKEEAGKMHYTGGGVISSGAFGHGFYEARFRVPAGAGWHTSFWMMKHSGAGGTGTAGAAQEVDVCEQDSVRPTRYGVNLHRWSPKPHKDFGAAGVKTPDLSEGFHVFGCEFTAEAVKFFFDGKLVRTADASGFEHGPQNVWLTSIASHLGGTKGVDETKLPAAAEFDYVRYFEKE